MCSEIDKILSEHNTFLDKFYKHKNKPIELPSLREVIDKTKQNQSMLNEVHSKLKG